MKPQVITIAIFGLVWIQMGCSNVRLFKEQASVASQADFSGTFCSAAAESSSEYLNVIFVVDMSASNIEGSTKYPPLPTDFNQNAQDSRLSMVASFPDQTCLAGRKSVRFAAVGFSKEIIGRSSSCASTDLLGDKELLQQEIQTLKDVQNHEKQLLVDGIHTGTKMTDTLYEQGFRCANSLVTSHINSLNEADRLNNGYLIYFLTDGAPTDFYHNIPQVKNRIGPIIDQTMEQGNQAGGILLQPIMYGYDKLSTQDKSEANEILDFVALKGGTTKVALDKISDINFCSLLTSGKKQSYVVANFGVANLTALMKKGRLISDSDMDGLSDEEESGYGFNPANPRSGSPEGHFLLDGLCPKGTALADCTGYSSCSNTNALGFSDCDAGAYGLTDALDTNRNLIPDNLEFLKGSSPTIDQSLSDLDGDGRLAFEELSRGRDPNFVDDAIDPTLLLSYHHERLQEPLPGCGLEQESWRFAIERMPTVPVLSTLGVSDPVTRSQSILLHDTNENIVFIYYFVKKANESPSNPGSATLFGRYLKVKFPTGTVVPLGDFVQMGATNGIFKAGESK